MQHARKPLTDDSVKRAVVEMVRRGLCTQAEAAGLAQVSRQAIWLWLAEDRTAVATARADLLWTIYLNLIRERGGYLPRADQLKAVASGKGSARAPARPKRATRKASVWD